LELLFFHAAASRKKRLFFTLASMTKTRFGKEKKFLSSAFLGQDFSVRKMKSAPRDEGFE
jgi:hypothetical protein